MPIQYDLFLPIIIGGPKTHNGETCNNRSLKWLYMWLISFCSVVWWTTIRMADNWKVWRKWKIWTGKEKFYFGGGGTNKSHSPFKMQSDHRRTELYRSMCINFHLNFKRIYFFAVLVEWNSEFGTKTGTPNPF